MVDFHEDLYLREITVDDEAGNEREIRLFFAHDFHMSGHEVAFLATVFAVTGAVLAVVVWAAKGRDMKNETALTVGAVGKDNESDTAKNPAGDDLCL